MTRPEFAVAQKTRYNKSAKRLIGLPATESVIRHGLDLIGMYINDYCHEIDFDEMLEQLLNYSYENKKKYVKETETYFIDLAKDTVFETELNDVLEQIREAVKAEDEVER